jgi:hypothetical protein
VSAENGNALFSAFPLAESPPIRVGIAKDGDEYAWPDLYASDAIRIGRPQDGNEYPPATGGPPVAVTYGLAAVDTGSGRQYWQSPTVSFVFAPVPVGAWVTSSLSIMYQV